MTFFVLLISVPALLFCCLALVHFQREILKGERTVSPPGNRISLDWQDENPSQSAVSQIDSRADGWVELEKGAVYQRQTGYLGPFFVVRAENARDWQLTTSCDEQHRVLSAARG